MTTTQTISFSTNHRPDALDPSLLDAFGTPAASRTGAENLRALATTLYAVMSEQARLLNPADVNTLVRMECLTIAPSRYGVTITITADGEEFWDELTEDGHTDHVWLA